jgi:hypothetical protein
MIKWPSINLPNLSGKDRNDFDSILPISYSSDKNKKSFMGYIYDTSSSIGTAISGSCQVTRRIYYIFTNIDFRMDFFTWQKLRVQLLVWVEARPLRSPKPSKTRKSPM